MSMQQTFYHEPIRRNSLGPYFRNRRYESSRIGQVFCSATMAFVISSAVAAALMTVFA